MKDAPLPGTTSRGILAHCRRTAASAASAYLPPCPRRDPKPDKTVHRDGDAVEVKLKKARSVAVWPLRRGGCAEDAGALRVLEVLCPPLVSE